MKVDITTNIPEFQDLIAKRRRAVRPALRKAVTDGTAEVLTLARSWMDRLIYVPPIPEVERKSRRGKDGKFRGANGRFTKTATVRRVAAWRRTSNLLRKERADFGQISNLKGVIDNQAPYAQPRHDLNRPSPIDGKVRRAPWRRKATEEGRPRVRDIFLEAVRAAMNQK